MSSPANPTPVRVILLTAEIEKGQIVEALRLGARGIVLTDSKTRVLFNAIQTVMADEYWVHREQVSDLVQYLRTLMPATHDEARQKKFTLMPRELEVVSLVPAGYSDKEIVKYFKISEDRVKHHLGNIYDKLGASTRRGLINVMKKVAALETPGITKLSNASRRICGWPRLVRLTWAVNEWNRLPSKVTTGSTFRCLG